MRQAQRQQAARVVLRAILVLLAFSAAAAAQSEIEFWPQVDANIAVTPELNLLLMASGSTDGDRRAARYSFGPTLSVAILPFLNPRLKTLNPERSRFLTFSAGYRFVDRVSRGTTENRGVLDLTVRMPQPAKFQIADRNRIDLRGLETRFAWRYRNKLTLSHSLQVRKLIFTPYAAAEVFYDCTAGQWSRYNYSFGSIFRVSSEVQLEPYFQHGISIPHPQNNEAKAVGLQLELFFHRAGAP